MQGKLIDADKLLEWMKTAYKEKSQDPYEIGKNHMATMIENLAYNGTFDPDPIPLPTIKPGDTYQILNEVLKVVDELELYYSNPKAHQRIMAAVSGEGEVSHD